MPSSYPPVSIEEFVDPCDAPRHTNVPPSGGSLLEGPFDPDYTQTYDEFFASVAKSAANRRQGPFTGVGM
jgi:hypothetical protein